MIFHETKLKGAFIIDLEPFKDDRGLFARTFCKKQFSQIGHHKEFVQFNHSYTKDKGTIRGMHYQKPPHAEIKLIRCIKGGVFDVIIDIRKQSPTFLEYVGVELTEQNMRMIYVPEGFAHGFQTLEDHTALIYHHTAFYEPTYEAGIHFRDPAIAIRWPQPPTIISKKDGDHIYLTPTFEGITNE